MHGEPLQYNGEPFWHSNVQYNGEPFWHANVQYNPALITWPARPAEPFRHGAILARYRPGTEARGPIASVPGLPRSVRVLIMRMRKRQTFEERGRLVSRSHTLLLARSMRVWLREIKTAPGRKHHVRVDVGYGYWWAWHVIFLGYQAFLTLRSGR